MAIHLAIDSNLFVLFIVGTTSRRLISTHKRCKTFDETDYDILLEKMREAGEIIVTAAVLAETSNLIRQIGELSWPWLTGQVGGEVKLFPGWFMPPF